MEVCMPQARHNSRKKCWPNKRHRRVQAIWQNIQASIIPKVSRIFLKLMLLTFLTLCLLMIFFFVADSPIASLVRSGSFMSAPKQTNVVKKGSIDGNGGASDDSMHEKYFKSVENTPVSKRKNQSLSAGSNQKHSSDSSPHSPMSPKKNVCMRDLFIVHWHKNVRWIMLVLLSFFLS